MRLTLRTLLAYLDESLEPADAEEIGKKIESSEFAPNLVQRIRNTVRRQRLGAPKLFGKGLGHDPNSVAEYLDSVLPHDRVGEFEKICLESDVHLAEAAACHQVLTLVFVEPAPTEFVSRDRIYRLEQLADSKAASAVATPLDAVTGGSEAPPRAVSAGSVSAAGAVRPASGAAAQGNGAHPIKAVGNQVRKRAAAEQLIGAPLASDSDEDPLHEPEEGEAPPARRRYADHSAEAQQRSIWPVVATLAGGFVIALLALRAMGEFNAMHPLARLFNSDGPVTSATGNPATREAKAKGKRTPSASKRRAAAESTDAKAAAGADAIDPSDSVADSADTAGGSVVDNGAPTTAPPAPPAAAAAAVAAVGGVDGADAEAADADSEGADDADAAEAGVDEATPPPLLLGLDLGTASAEKQLLVRHDESAARWLRVANGGPIRSGDHLTALPLYRPSLVLASGITATLVGPATCRIDATSDAKADPAAAGALRLTVSDGAVLLSTTAGQTAPGAPIQLNLGGHAGIVELENPETHVAAFVQHTFVPGAEFEKQAAPLTVEVLALGGNVTWQPISEGESPAAAAAAESAAAMIVIHEGEKLVIRDSQPAGLAPAGAVPAWINAPDSRALEQMTAATLESLIAADRSVVLSLLEQVTYRQIEVGLLATQSLGYLDQFEPFVEALNRDAQKSNWDAQIDTLRRALARGPESAKLVRETFEKLRGDAAPELFRLLIGYNAEQLEDDGAAELVQALEHESLDVRVLAIKNLELITGRTELYRPDVSIARRQQPVKRWRERLETGFIRYPTTPGAPASSKAPGAAKRGSAPAPTKKPAIEEPAGAEGLAPATAGGEPADE